MEDKSTISRYSDAELEEFKAIIDKKLTRAREELSWQAPQSALNVPLGAGRDFKGEPGLSDEISSLRPGSPLKNPLAPGAA